MNRRKFLSNVASGWAGTTFLPTLLYGCAEKHDALHDFGLITNVVRKLMEADHRATMAMLAEMGYKYLEFGGTYGEDALQLRKFMDSIGLIPLAGGTSMAGLQGDGLKMQMDATLAMDKKYLVCYWPWMDDGKNPTWDKVNFALDQLHIIGEKCNESGIRFAFHNHDYEFLKLDGRVIYDHILEKSDPDLVTMEVDLYWAHKGGADIREYFTKYPGRFELVHVKDSYDSPDRESFACVGSGIIDFQEILSYRYAGGFKHLIVEHDRPEQERECAQSSIETLKALDF